MVEDGGGMEDASTPGGRNSRKAVLLWSVCVWRREGENVRSVSPVTLREPLLTSPLHGLQRDTEVEYLEWFPKRRDVDGVFRVVDAAVSCHTVINVSKQDNKRLSDGMWKTRVLSTKFLALY